MAEYVGISRSSQLSSLFKELCVKFKLTGG